MVSVAGQSKQEHREAEGGCKDPLAAASQLQMQLLLGLCPVGSEGLPYHVHTGLRCSGHLGARETDMAEPLSWCEDSQEPHLNP